MRRNKVEKTVFGILAFCSIFIIGTIILGMYYDFKYYSNNNIEDMIENHSSDYVIYESKKKSDDSVAAAKTRHIKDSIEVAEFKRKLESLKK